MLSSGGMFRRRLPSARLAPLLALGILLPGDAAAQETFTQQLILVVPFEGKDTKLGGSVADQVRGRLKHLVKKREAAVIDEFAMEQLLTRSSLEVNELDSSHVRVLAKQMRADEVVTGWVERLPRGAVRVRAQLALARDKKLVQHLKEFTAPSTDSAGSLIATELELVRRQLAPHRRCENAARAGKYDEAITTGRATARTLPRSALLRGCVTAAMVLADTDAREVADEASKILAEEPRSYWGLDAAARAWDAIGDKPKAADAWLRLAATDSNDIPLGKKVLDALLRGGNAPAARDVVVRLSDENPDDFELLRLRWQVQYTVRDWPGVVKTGDRLAYEDTVSRADSTFAFRLATAYRSKGDTVKAISVVADGVSRFPKDARLYVLYADLVQGDSRVAIARGLERFPDLAELHVLRAQEQRRAGKTAEAVASLQKAATLDTALAVGFLALAQMQVDLGQLDSAYATVQKALKAGEPVPSVAAFALARGNAIYRAANGTRQRSDYQLAMQYLALADSLQGSPQSRFLLGVTALAISQSAAQEAPTAKACDLSKLAGQLLPLAREKITAGAQVAPDAARQYLAYLDQLEPVVGGQVAALCT